MMKPFLLALALMAPTLALAEDRVVTITGGQVSVPVGLMVQVKSIAIGEDATTVHLLASFDSHQTNSVNMNDSENAYLSWGEEEGQRLFLRQLQDNKWMRIGNGQTMEGDLVFPGAIPADVTSLTLVFNPGQPGTDTSAPGVTIPLELNP